jgi:ATP-dependent exoDNAse (exonuclease V) beta subunit
VASMDIDLARDPERVWRATGGSGYPPAAVVGTMVHAALRMWCFPGDKDFASLLETEALSAGLVEARQRQQAMREATKLLDRLPEHPLSKQISEASERYHELPYTQAHSKWGSDSGRIDLLFHSPDGWRLIDFKTDELHDEAALYAAVDEYRPQMQRYIAATAHFLGETPHAALCFLDAEGGVRLVEVA